MLKLLFSVLGSAINPISKVAGSYLKGKAKERTEILDYEKQLAKQMKGSWKDEYLTIVFTSFIPIILLGILFSSFEWTADFGNNLKSGGEEMARVINEITGGNFHNILMLIVSASFGVHVSRTVKAGKLGGVVKQMAEKREEKEEQKKKSGFWGNHNDIHGGK